MSLGRPNKQKHKYREGVLVRLPALVMTLGILVSVLFHAGVVVWLFGEPIGYVDPMDLKQQRHMTRVKRAMLDRVVLEEIDLGEADKDAGQDPAGQNRNQNSGSQAQDLLQATEIAMAEVTIDDALELRTAEVVGDVVDTEAAALEMPMYELPNEALDMLDGKLFDAGFQDVNETGFGVERRADEAGGITARRLLAGEMDELKMLGGSGIGNIGEIDKMSGHTEQRGSLIAKADAQDRLARMGGLNAGTSGLGMGELLGMEDLNEIGGLLEADEIELFGGKPKALDEDFDYLVRRYEKGDDAGWFEVEVSALRSLAKLPSMRKDVVFLIDTSGSIDQEWINQVKRGVASGLNSLNKGDRFNIVLFNERVEMLREQGLIQWNDINAEEAGRFLWQARSKGATDVNAALSRMLVRDVEAGRVLNIILISDGQPTKGVSDTRDLINLITRDNDLTASIYCVGIGGKPNRELLNFLAYRNKGYSVFVERRGETMPIISKLMSRLRYPIIKNLSVRVAGKHVDNVYPVHLANIHQGEQFSIFGRYWAQDEFTLQVTGFNHGKPVDFTLKRDLSKASQGRKQISNDWALWKLHHLYSEILLKENSDDLKDQVKDLQREYRMKTLY